VWLTGVDVSLGQVGFRPDGWLVGSVYADNDGDGWRAPDEIGLGGVEVTLSGPAVKSTTTAPDGSFAMRDLPDGSYAVTVVEPSGFAALPATSVTLASGGRLSLGLQTTGQVSGAAYEDWDGDGRRLPDEPLLVHPLTMTLGAETTVLYAGRFLFWDVAPGSYVVGAQYGAVSQAAVSPQSGGGVSLDAVPAGVVRGTVWHDADGDATRQPWEVPLSGVEVRLGGRTAVTDQQGRFKLRNVPAGTHTVTANLPDDLEATVPAFSTDEQRGATVGIAAGKRSGYQIFVPLVMRSSGP
jgi:hypothetical protein